jgi:predicted PurR-regulated permease PerM
MDLKFTPGRLYGAAVIALSIWLVHGFVHGLLAAGVAAIASWPLYARFSAHVRKHVGEHVTALMFTAIMTVFVLAPMVFAFWALLSESHTLFREIAAADERGIVFPPWLHGLPLLGRWQSDLSSPGALLGWTQRTDATAFLGLSQSLGQFAARHFLILVFTILLLFFLYERGESLARDFRRCFRQVIGERSERHVEVVTRAVRASVSSMLVVGLFDGFATGLSYAIVGIPRAPIWGAIVGSIAAIPFLGYGAVATLALRIAMEGQATLALVSLVLGWTALLAGDKVVRPLVTREAIRLPFVWILMGCLGGFDVLGLIGLVIGPVVLALARELWDQRVRELDGAPAGATPFFTNEILSCTRPAATSTTCDAS